MATTPRPQRAASSGSRSCLTPRRRCARGRGRAAARRRRRLVVRPDPAADLVSRARSSTCTTRRCPAAAAGRRSTGRSSTASHGRDHDPPPRARPGCGRHPFPETVPIGAGLDCHRRCTTSSTGSSASTSPTPRRPRSPAIRGRAGRAPGDVPLHPCARRRRDRLVRARPPTSIGWCARCSQPFPAAFTWLGLDRLHIDAVEPCRDAPAYEGRVPGPVVRVDRASGAVDVLTGDGVIRLHRVRVEDGERAQRRGRGVVRADDARPADRRPRRGDSFAADDVRRLS